MANKVRYGLRNLHIAFRDIDNSDSSGDPVWGTPRAIPGAVSFKPTAEGDENKFFADDGPYFTSQKNNGYIADLEVASLPDDVVAEMFGWETDANGAIIEDADALPAPFAIMFEVQGDSRARRIVYYECTAARPEHEEKTTEASTSPSPETFKLTAVPIEIGGRMTPKASLELSDTNASVYNAFFDSVYVETPVA